MTQNNQQHKRIERRFLILKLSDIDRYLNVNDRHTVNLIAGVITRKREEEKRAPVSGLYIDKQWPIYPYVEDAFLHWLNGDKTEGPLTYIQQLEKKLAEKTQQAARLQDENLSLVGEVNRLKKSK